MKNGIVLMLSGVMLSMSLAAAESVETTLVARRDFDASSLWKPKIFMERDFWNVMQGARFNPKGKDIRNSLYFPISELPENMRKHLDIPAFTEVMLITPPFDRSAIRKNDDGTITLVPPDDYREWVPADRPFITRSIRLIRLFPRLADLTFLSTYKPDPEIYREWRKRYPNLYGASGLEEWGNHMNVLFLKLRGDYIKQGFLTEEQVEKIAERYHENPPTRRDYVNHRLKPYFDFAAGVWHGDPSILDAMDGMWNIGHLAAYWGAGSINMETSRVNVNWQYQLMFHRGAARQFDIPWGWYAAAHTTIYDANGRPTTMGAEPRAWTPDVKVDRLGRDRSGHTGPDAGASLNSRERVSYMAYLSGANTYQRETAGGNYWDQTAAGDDRWKPAPEGQMYIDFFNFTRRHPDRGIPYTPIALLVAHDRGTFRLPGKAFGRYRYLKSDNMLDAFVVTLFPPESTAALHKKGIEITLKNGKYGELFDALTPDFEKPDAFARILPAYKAAILIGEYEEHPGMVKAMVDYVDGGGTLILNSKQLNLRFPDGFTGVEAAGQFADGDYLCALLKPAGAEVLLADGENRPVFTRNAFGKGAVIVAAPHFLVPHYDDAAEEAGNEARARTVSGQVQFPHVQWLLDRLLEEVRPAAVTGDIQYGFNRTADGWWIYLFNNKGVLKTSLTPQQFDPAAKTDVEIDLTRIGADSATDLVGGETFSGGKFKVSVDPGKYRILKIENR